MLAFSHTTPVYCDIGLKVTSTFKKLSGDVTITQTDETIIEIVGQFKQGMIDTDTNPDNYYFEADLDRVEAKISFTELGAQIILPGTTAFQFAGNALVEEFIGKTLSVTHQNTTLDSTVAN